MKYLIILASLLITFSLFGQNEKPIKKGNFLLGGYANFSYQTQEEESYQVGISPSIGFFVANNVSIGLRPTFGYYRNNSGDQTFQQRTIGAGPFIKCYFNSGFLVELDSYFLWGKNMSEHGIFGSSEREFKQIMLSPGIGYAFFINNKVSIETKLIYNIVNYSYENDDSENYQSLLLGLGFQIFL